MNAPPTVEAEVVGRPDNASPPFRGVVILGLVIAGTAPLWVLVPEGVAGVPFVAPFVAVPLLAAAAVRWLGSWARLVGMLAALGLLVVVAPFAAEVVGHPDSFFDFFPVTSLLAGALVAVGGSVASAIHLRRGARDAGRHGRVLAGATIVLLVVLAGLSGALTFTGRQTVSAVDRFGADPVALTDFEFEPAELTVQAGTTARFVVRNDDLALHTFTIDELGVDTVVKPGREALVELTPEHPGRYLLYCRPHTQDGEGMVATVTVE